MRDTYLWEPVQTEVDVTSVTTKEGRTFAELKDNPFYPDGKGGQCGDRGKVGTAKILFVEERGVFLDGNVNPGKQKIEVDIERRKEIARQHTAQHVLSAAVEELFGVKTVGFHMGEVDTTVDFERPVDVEKAIELSNDVILDDIEVNEIIVDPEEANEYDLRKPLSSKALQSGKIRLIRIGNFDISACSGFHVSRTGQIGIVRVIHSERVKGGLQRVWFLAGKRALKDCRKKEEILLAAAKIFDASWTDLNSRIEKTVKELKEKRNELKKMAEELANYISSELSENSVLEVNEAVASFITRKRQDIPYILRFSESNVVISVPFVKKDEVMTWAHRHGFKGGGKGPIYRFVFSNFDDFTNAFEELVNR